MVLVIQGLVCKLFLHISKSKMPYRWGQECKQIIDRQSEVCKIKIVQNMQMHWKPVLFWIFHGELQRDWEFGADYYLENKSTDAIVYLCALYFVLSLSYLHACKKNFTSQIR